MRYIAKQIPFDRQESNFEYFPGDEEYIIFGNDNFKSYTTNLFDHMIKVFEDGFMIDELSKYNNITSKEFIPECKKIIKEYFPDMKMELTDNVIYKFRAATNYCYWALFIRTDYLTDIYSILTGKRYKHQTISGSVQSEWNIIIYPSDYTTEQIRTIEMDYFNTGSEYLVCSENDPNYSEFVYVHGWNNEENKKEISEIICCSPNEIEIHNFTGYSQIPNYD